MWFAVPFGMTNTSPNVTCEVPVFYATSEGQTRRIAERIASEIARAGFTSRAIDMASPTADALDWTGVAGTVVGASIHMGKHQPSADRFVRHHLLNLNRVPSAFFSVSLSAASKNPAEVQAAELIANRFPAERGWTPKAVVSVAGRLAYRQYGFVIRWIMKRIAKKEGAPTDTSRDYELTNWEQVDGLARDLAARIHRRVSAA